MKQANFNDFGEAKAAISKFSGYWAQEHYEAEKRRKLRNIEIDIKQMGDGGLIAQN